MTSEHITKVYDAELQRLRETVADMGRLAAAELQSALAALAARDEEMATEVVGSDQLVNDREYDIEAMAGHIIALRQPMAADLRAIIGAMKVASDLERIGDHAKNIARHTMTLSKLLTTGTESKLLEVGGAVRAALRRVMQAYIEQDSASAREVRSNDVAIDRLYNEVFREILSTASRDAHGVSAAIHQAFIARSLERIGDHCTNIAEDVMYMVDGVMPQDDRPKADETAFMTIEE
jgi:phosphate transport system protein